MIKILQAAEKKAEHTADKVKVEFWLDEEMVDLDSIGQFGVVPDVTISLKTKKGHLYKKDVSDKHTAVMEVPPDIACEECPLAIYSDTDIEVHERNHNEYICQATGNLVFVDYDLRKIPDSCPLLLNNILVTLIKNKFEYERTL